MIQVSREVAVVAAVAFVVVAGCGGTTPEPADEAPAAATSAPVSRNACDLIDRGELEAIVGQKLEMLHEVEDGNQSACELRAATDDTPLVYVTVHWSGGKEQARVNAAAMGMARQLLNEPDLDIDTLTGSETVPGLADQAYYSDVMPSWVVKDDIFIEVISPRFGGDQTKAVFLAVARTALSRL